MIIKCKVCQGSGKIEINFLLGTKKICPVCGGAGEFEINEIPEKLVVCKVCRGTGKVGTNYLTNEWKLCPRCKGQSVIVRPSLGSAQNTAIGVPLSNKEKAYDVTVSFAGEDRLLVQRYVGLLKKNAINVFYDQNDEVGLWGTNLYDKLDQVYRRSALFCVVFISKYYAQKAWTNHERQSAQARALKETREYILPVRLDDTEIPGILPTTQFVDLRTTTVEKLAAMTAEKVRRLRTH